MGVQRWSAAELARAAGVKVQAVHRARLRGTLEGTRTGRAHWYYTTEQATAWLERKLRRA